MNAKSISMCEGKGSLSHNNREFTAKNIDPLRTPDNIVFVQQDLGETYHQLFDEAVERYNARQKRNDRKINDYFEHLFNRPPRLLPLASGCPAPVQGATQPPANAVAVAGG